jgi:LacI family transcriptional regulator
VFSANDIMAIGCMAGLVAKGVAVPREVAIVGFDDIPVARYVTPALSTMGLGIAALGERAVERLIEAIEQPDGDPPEPERLVPHLVVRGSSARRDGGGAPSR